MVKWITFQNLLLSQGLKCVLVKSVYTYFCHRQTGAHQFWSLSDVCLFKCILIFIIFSFCQDWLPWSEPAWLVACDYRWLLGFLHRAVTNVATYLKQTLQHIWRSKNKQGPEVTVFLVLSFRPDQKSLEVMNESFEIHRLGWAARVRKQANQVLLSGQPGIVVQCARIKETIIMARNPRPTSTWPMLSVRFASTQTVCQFPGSWNLVNLMIRMQMSHKASWLVVIEIHEVQWSGSVEVD